MKFVCVFWPLAPLIASYCAFLLTESIIASIDALLDMLRKLTAELDSTG